MLTTDYKQTAINTWANERRLNVDLERRYSGPQILWMQGGGVLSKKDRLSFLVVLRRPKHRYVSHVEVASYLPEEEPHCEGIIERPVADSQFVQSTFRCEVGDIIVLEGEERLRCRKEGDADPRDLCMLTTLHSTMEHTAQE